MKKYIFHSILAFVAAAAFTACSDDELKYDGPGQWDANAGYADIYFKETSKTESIDPAADTKYSIKVYRHVEHEYVFDHYKDSLGYDRDSILSDKITTPLPALTVKPVILENTDGVFTVSDAVFAEGDTVATITVNFPDATIGKEHTLAVTVQGADLVSSYSNSVLYTYNVTRVKWNLLEQKAKFRDDFIFGEAWEVEVMQRDDDHSYYRIMDPYGKWAAELNGEQSEYIQLHILSKGDKMNDVELEENGVVDWYRICSGWVHPSYGNVVWGLHPQNFTAAEMNTAEIYAYSKVSEWLENGDPGQIQLAPYWYMFGLGGWNYTTEPTIFINMPGYVEQYEASIDEDFEWADEYEGVWKSEQLGTSTTALLQKGTCVTTTDQCDSVFNANYGTAYKVIAPYAEDYDLVFCARGRKIILAPEYEDPQPIGINALGNDVYAIINTDESSFADGVITLSINFVSLDEDGEEVTVDYGTATEQLLNLTYTEVGKGVYTYGARLLQTTAGSYYEGTEEATLYQCDQLPSEYYLTPWADSEEGFAFTVRDDNTIKFNQYTGVADYVEEGESYGPVYFYDIEFISPNNADYLGTYDKEKGLFEFVGAYFLPDVGGFFGYIAETFQLNQEAPAAARSVSAKQLHMQKGIQVAPRFTGTKVQPWSYRHGKKLNNRLVIR